MRRLLTLLAACALAAAMPLAGAKEPAAPAELRGTWLTTTANDALATPANTSKTMERLAAIGLNTVYIETWKDGYTQFPSRTLKKLVGVDRHPALAASQRDLLEESLIAAHRNRLHAIAWFEYGFMAQYAGKDGKDAPNLLRQKKPEWLSRDAAGSEVAPNGYVWLNPLHPEVRVFLRDLMLEAARSYDIDGIQLDDHFSWPDAAMGYDETTKALYAAEHGGKAPPADARDAAWLQWRTAKLGEAVQWIAAEVKRAHPGLLLSLSPAPQPWSREQRLADWSAWRGFDEIVPQAYRASTAEFEQTWQAQVGAAAGMGETPPARLAAGIRITGSGPDSSWDQLRASIEAARKGGAAGHVLWFSRGVLDLYEKELTAFYGGRSAHPLLAERGEPVRLWRAPMRATRLKEAWKTRDLPRGRYTLVGRSGDTWEVLREVEQDRPTTVMSETYVFESFSYNELELLPSRRDELRRKLVR